MKNTFKLFLLEADELSKKELTALIAEWEMISQKLEVLNVLTKKMSSRTSEIEKIMKPIAKATEAHSITIKSTISTYSETSRKSTSYQKAFEKALEIVNEDQKAVLDTYLISLTKNNVTEHLTMISSKVSKIAEKVKNAKDDISLNKLAAEILELQIDNDEVNEGVISNFKTLAKKSIDWFKSWVSEMQSKLSKLDHSVKKLKEVVQSK